MCFTTHFFRELTHVSTFETTFAVERKLVTTQICAFVKVTCGLPMVARDVDELDQGDSTGGADRRFTKLTIVCGGRVQRIDAFLS